MTLRNLGIVAILMLGMVSEAPAQSCPYNVNCTPSYSEPFPNVLYRMPGLEHAVVSTKNLTAEEVQITIEVTVGAVVWGRAYPIPANGRIDVFITDPIEWFMFADHRGGVSVVVKSTRAVDSTVTMHPADAALFVSGAKFLEGK